MNTPHRERPGFWTNARVRDSLVLILGCGRLGGAMADGLASAGHTSFAVVDPGRTDTEDEGPHQRICRRDLGKPKAFVKQNRVLARHPSIRFEAVHARGEAACVDKLVEEAILVLIATNSPNANAAIQRNAIRFGKPSIRAGLTDARAASFGTIGFHDPRRPWHACAGCLLPSSREPVRGEYLHYPIAAMVASHAAQIATQVLSGRGEQLGGNNLWIIDGERHSIESMAVERRPDCHICGTERG